MLRSDMGAAMMLADYDMYNRTLDHVRDQMGYGAFTAAAASGGAMTLDQAVAFALSGESTPRA
jgi:hypothetical protein